MKIGVLGTGMVGKAVASRLVALGHEVRIGARDASNEAARSWASVAGSRASSGTFKDAATFGDVVFSCTLGSASLHALAAAGAAALNGKILVDVSNPLDFSKGMPPSLFVSGDDSLAERIQRAFPGARVVKTLNTVTASVMVEPASVPGEHEIFVSGDDAGAKALVRELLGTIGWARVRDLGPLSTARGTESYLLLWLSLYQSLGTADFNLRIVTR